jgi:hypothetical protein
MLSQIIKCFENEPHSILSAKNISKKLAVKRKKVSVILNNSPNFKKTEFNDTGCGKYRTNTFKMLV